MATTERLHTLLEIAFQHFNLVLFDKKLPKVLFSEHGEKGMMAYFSPDRWTSGSGKKHHEIAVNLYQVCSASLLELLQLLVHEMVHAWQYEFGQSMDKKHDIYHNMEWSQKMSELGLIPSSTGKPGGKKTGEHMSDYPKAGGIFLQSCIELLSNKEFSKSWNYRLDELRQIRNIEPHVKKLIKKLDQSNAQVLMSSMNSLLGGKLIPKKYKANNKTKYTCPSCNIHVWGKPNLKLVCNDCDEVMVVESRKH